MQIKIFYSMIYNNFCNGKTAKKTSVMNSFWPCDAIDYFLKKLFSSTNYFYFHIILK